MTQRDVDRKKLAISTGEGHLETEAVMVDGEKVYVTVFSQRNIHMAPDPGWNYNPGAVDWKPDLKKYDDDIARLG